MGDQSNSDQEMIEALLDPTSEVFVYFWSPLQNDRIYTCIAAYRFPGSNELLLKRVGIRFMHRRGMLRGMCSGGMVEGWVA